MSEKIGSELKSWTGVFVGCFIMAVAFVFFINPYNIVPGGVYGASIALHTLFPSIMVGTFGYMFDIPLLILSILLLGSKLGAKTCAASLSTPAMMNGLSMLVYPTREALEAQDPSLLLNGWLDMSNELMLAVVIGSVLIGVGCGIIVRCGATSGGSDIVGMILHKFLHLRFSHALLLVDGMVVLFGMVVFSLSGGGNALILSLYSLICIYLSARMVARTITGSKDDKIIFIISEKDLPSLHSYILTDLDRTATIIKSAGLYSKADKQMLFFVCSYKEVQMIKAVIKQADPTAFVVVTDAYDTYGEGWKQLPSSGDLQPE